MNATGAVHQHRSRCVVVSRLPLAGTERVQRAVLRSFDIQKTDAGG